MTFDFSNESGEAIEREGRYDEESVHAILDAGLVAQVAFVQEGRPVVVPMIWLRRQSTLPPRGP